MYTCALCGAELPPAGRFCSSCGAPVSSDNVTTIAADRAATLASDDVATMEFATPASPGLCPTCQHSRRIESDRGSMFIRCELSLEDSRFPKYPRLPVLDCNGYRPKSA